MKNISIMHSKQFTNQTSPILLKASHCLRRSAFFLLMVLCSAFAYAQPGPGIANINPPTGDFQIEGDLQANTPVSGKGDWIPGPAGTGGSVLNAAGVATSPLITFHLID